VTLLVAFFAVVAGAVFIVVHYLVGSPPTVDYTTAAHNGVVNVTLQETPLNNSSSKPDWVSYYVMKPGGNPMSVNSWVHTTLFDVPGNTRVNMTIYGYDGCTPLRNNFWSGIQGVVGGKVAVQAFENPGKPVGPVVITPIINSWAHCAVAHTFAIPSLHVFVPVASPSATTNGNKNGLCSSAPCVTGPFMRETFSFMTPAHGGVFRWQCLIPCGGGYVFGNGGPMQTIGYMTGNMTVVGS
jgi:hypothetical protein